MSQEQAEIVADSGQARLSDLYRKEDYWAIWIGLFIMAVAICLVFSGRSSLQAGYRPLAEIMQAEAKKPFRTIEWYEAQAAASELQGQKLPAVAALIGTLKGPGAWQSNPLDSLFMSKSRAAARNRDLAPRLLAARQDEKEALIRAREAQTQAQGAGFGDPVLNDSAKSAIAAWQKARASREKLARSEIKPFNRLPSLLLLGLGLGLITGIGACCMGFSARRYCAAFAGVYLLCVLANVLGAQASMKHYGLNAEIWSIVIGMLIANCLGTPGLLREGAQVEYFIKTGLVLLGAEVLFHKILAIGLPGIFVAWVVTPVVLVSTYIFGQKLLKMPSPTLNIVISADMSVCGTSAAIATAAAARAKKEELTLAIGLSLAFTAIMMVAMPIFIRAVGMPEVLGGAWIGGTIDATGAVAAAGVYLGDTALQVAATVKMIQNVLIGAVAFCVALYWTTRVEPGSGRSAHVGAGEIWMRFPKFVIGFLTVSIALSLICQIIGPAQSKMLVDNGVIKISAPLRSWFFGLAFVSIGLTTNFRQLGSYFRGGKPIILYVCGQSLNLLLTLLMAWLMFYKVFPEATANI